MKLYRNVTQIADVKPLDTSYIKRAVMAENSFQMDFYSKVVVNIKRGDYCTAYGAQYFVSEAPIPEVTKGVYKYSVKMTSTREELDKCILRQFGSSEVVYTCTPLEFLQLVVSCMQAFQPTKGWTVGACIAGPVLTVSFTGQTCLQAMQTACGEQYWNTEFYTEGFTLNFKKQETTPVPIKSFSIGNGLKTITQEKNTSRNYYSRLYAHGGTKNLPSTYTGKRLKMDVAYIEDATASVIIEKEERFEDIFPRRTGTLSEVSTTNGVYYFKDAALPYNPNDLQIDGLSKHVVFKTGDLIGLDFEVNYNPVTGFFELIPYTDSSGFSWPSVAEKPAVNDTYVLYNIEAPQAHIDAAMVELKAAAQAALDAHKTEPVSLNVTTDDGYFFQNGTELVLGEVIKVSHTEIPALIGGRNIRITEFKRYLNTTYKYDSLKVSDVVYSNPITDIKEKVDKTEKILDKAGISHPTYSSRNWADMAELANMINTLRASMLLIGEVQGAFTIPGVAFTPNYQNNKNMFYASAGQLVHTTIPTEDNPGTWALEALTEIVTGDTTPFYVYAKCSRINTTAIFYLSTTEIGYDSDPNFYYFFIGGLSSVLSGSRVFATVYGYTQITGNSVKTGVIISVNGTTKFDLDNNSIQLGDKLKYNVNGDGQLVIDGSIMQHTSVKDDGGNISEITLDRGPFTLSMNPFFPGNITTFEGAAYLCHTLTVPGVVPTNTNYFRPYSEKGAGGKSPVFGYLTNEHNPLSASNAGVVADYSKAGGQFKMYRGDEDVTPYSTFKAVAKDCEGTIKESQQLIHDWTDGVVQGHLDTSANWQELSGLTAAYKAGNEKYLWVLSDSPANMIAAIKKADASKQGVWSLSGAPSKIDWEDIESSVVNGVPYLYVFDFGNNPNTVNSRGAGVDMVIHRILEPTITGNDGATAEYMSIQCAFPVANMPTLRDCEAAIIDPVTGDIYIITKREAVPGVYKLSHQDNYVGIQTLTYMGKMWDVPDATTQALGATACNVVDATINKQGTELIVKNYNNTYLFLRDPAIQTIYQALSEVPTIVAGYVGGGSNTPATSHPNAEPQGEGICFDEIGVHLFSHSEYATGSATGRFPLFKYSRINGIPTTFSMQEGVVTASAIYAGTRDTYIWDTNPDTAYGTAATFVIDNANATDVDRRKGLLRFELGGGVGIPANAIVVGARLDLNIAVEGQGYLMYKMLVPWTEESTFNTLGGITPDDVKASATLDCINAINLDGYIGQVRNNVPIATLQEWISNPEKNFGWMFDAADAATGDGVQISSREDAVIANRPKLTIRYVLPGDVAGYYKVTSMPTANNNGELQLTGTFDGVTVEKVFSVSKSKVGATGLQGASAALMPNRMNWVPGGTYEGSATRQDLARNPGDGIWYRANPAAGIFTDAVWTPAHWISFGYSGESVATILLLAQLANIANFIFKDGKMISQSGTINGAPSMDYANASFVPNLSLDGTTGKIEANDAVIRGRIEANIGKIGNFTIAGNSLLSDSMEFSEEALETLAALTEPLTYSINEPSSGAWTASGTGGNGITVVTLPLTLPMAAVISFDTYASLGGNYKLWEVFIEGADGSVPYYRTQNYSVSEHHTKALPAGSYTIRLYGYSDGLNTIQIKGTPTINVISAIAYVKKSKIGNNGLLSFQDSTHYLYYSFLAGLVSRGAIDIPGGLGGGFVAATGGVGAAWGKYTPTSAPKAGSTVTITHGIGDTNYMINVSPKDSASTWYWTNKQPNTIQVVITGAFDFSLSRTI